MHVYVHFPLNLWKYIVINLQTVLQSSSERGVRSNTLRAVRLKGNNRRRFPFFLLFPLYHSGASKLVCSSSQLQTDARTFYPFVVAFYIVERPRNVTSCYSSYKRSVSARLVT